MLVETLRTFNVKELVSNVLRVRTFYIGISIKRPKGCEKRETCPYAPKVNQLVQTKAAALS